MSEQELGQESDLPEGEALEGKQELEAQPKTRKEIDEESTSA